MRTVPQLLSAAIAASILCIGAPALANSSASAALDLQFKLTSLDGGTPSLTIPGAAGSLSDVMLGSLDFYDIESSASDFGSVTSYAQIPGVAQASGTVSGDIFGTGLSISTTASAGRVADAQPTLNASGSVNFAGGQQSTFTLSAHTSIEVIGTFDGTAVAGPYKNDAATAQMYLALGSQTLAYNFVPLLGGNIDDTRTFDFTITNDTNSTLTDIFRLVVGSGASTGPLVPSDPTAPPISTVPEPASLAMLLAGLAVAGLARRRG